MKKIIYICTICCLCIIDSTVYANEVEEWLKSTEQSEGDAPYSEAETWDFLEKAEPLLLKGSDNPYFYISVADFVRSLHIFYQRSLIKAGKYYTPNSAESQALIHEYQSYYLKAMDLDENPDVSMHLTGYMLSKIGGDLLGNPNIKARAYKKAGDLARLGKSGINHEPFEWNTYEARLGIYAQAKDYDNYLKTVNEMMERFPNTSRMDELVGYKRKVEDMIETLWAEEVTNSGKSIVITNDINEVRIKEADKFIQQGSLNPIVWYLRGSFGSERLGFYNRKLLKEGKHYDSSHPEVRLLINEYQRYYKKSLDLDDKVNAPDYLTEAMLLNIGTDELSAADVQKRAMNKAGKLAKADGGLEWNIPSDEWSAFKAKLHDYFLAKDYDNSLHAVNEMIERFPNSWHMGDLESYKRQAEAAIERRGIVKEELLSE